MQHNMFPSLLESQRWLRRVISSFQMRQLPSEGGVASGPALFAVVRNEMLRLPRFLAYYRERGIHRFFLVENNSTDGTASYLAEQKDVCLYQTQESFAKKEGRGGLSHPRATACALRDGCAVEWCERERCRLAAPGRSQRLHEYH